MPEVVKMQVLDTRAGGEPRERLTQGLRPGKLVKDSLGIFGAQRFL
jgi:hypothetical protein